MQKVHQTLNWHSLLVAKTKVNCFITESSQLLQHYTWLQHALTQFAFSYSDTIYLSFGEDYLIHHPTFTVLLTLQAKYVLPVDLCVVAVSVHFFRIIHFLGTRECCTFFFFIINLQDHCKPIQLHHKQLLHTSKKTINFSWC